MLVVIVMGVSGSGKTTFGQALARAVGWPFVEGDDLHPPANVAKMRRGIPLSDADRAPWLDRLGQRIHAIDRAGGDAVVACSALRQAYRDTLGRQARVTRYVWLDGDREVIADRLGRRRGHFMPPALLDSQFATLQPPRDAIRIDLALPVTRQVDEALAALGLERR